jgi:gluconolactonase
MPVATPPLESVTLTDRLRFPEGPISLPGGDVLVVEIAGQALTRVGRDGAVEVVAELDGGPNGAALGPDGHVYVCNSGGWRYERRGELTWPIGTSERTGWIERVDLATGRSEVLYERCGDIELRSPNDLVFDEHGGFFFTDLGKRSDRSIDWCSVYYALPDGSRITEVVHPIITPNGCGLSPDGSVLYVAETFTGRLWAFDVVAPGELGEGTSPAPHRGRLVAGVDGYRLFDSLAVHDSGLVCVATLFTSGITVCDPAGGEVRFVPLPDTYTTNLCFDVDGRDAAYVTQSSTGRLIEIPASALVGELP